LQLSTPVQCRLRKWPHLRNKETILGTTTFQLLQAWRDKFCAKAKRKMALRIVALPVLYGVHLQRFSAQLTACFRD
jgi:hypothetical protein